MQRIIVLTTVLFGLLGLSYCNELPKHARANNVEDAIKRTPWVREVRSSYDIDIASPVSWVWPAKREWVIAQPTLPGLTGRRFQVSHVSTQFDYDWNADLADPRDYLVDVDCEGRTIRSAHILRVQTEPAMLNPLGQPVVDNEGNIFRYYTGKIVPPIDVIERELSAYCDKDWSRERRALPA